MKLLLPFLSLSVAIACFSCAVDGGRELKHAQALVSHANITNMTKTIDSSAGVGKPGHPDKLGLEADEKCEEEEHEEEECEECDKEGDEDEHEDEDEECEECEEEKLVLEPKHLHKKKVPPKKVP